MLIYPHRIRLRGPWECQLPNTPPRRLHLPRPWSDVATAGLVRLVRPFGYPGNIDEGEHVWLTFAKVTAAVDVSLNGGALGAGLSGDFEFEVTGVLGKRNRLELVAASCDRAEPTWEEIALEIRRDAFLRDVRATRAHEARATRVAGVLIGPAGLELELYAIAGGRHVHYERIAALPDGATFAFTVDAADDVMLQLDLLHISEIWYSLQVPIARST